MADLEGAVLDAPVIDGGLDDGQDDGSLGDELDGQDAGSDDGADAGDADAIEGDGEAGDDEAGEGEQEPVTQDGRKMPDGLKKAIAALKATSPEQAKAIKGLYYSDQEYRAVFPKPEDAVAAKGIIEQMGGPEGVQALEAERAEWAEIDRGFAEGRPEFVKGLAEANPEAVVKMAPLMINEWATRAPEQYAYYSNQVSLNTLANAGISLPNLAAAYQKYGDGSQQETLAQSLIAEIHGALTGMKKSATEFEQKRVDPREESIKQRETAFETKRRADFEDGIDKQAKEYLKTKMQPEIDRIVNGRKVSEATMADYHTKVNAEVERRLGAVPGFDNQLEAFYRTGDAQGSLKYIQGHYNRIIGEAAKVIDPFVRDIPAARPVPGGEKGTKPGTRAAVGPGEVTLKDMPEWNQIDFDKCTPADVIQGTAVLKNGKKASGWA